MRLLAALFLFSLLYLARANWPFPTIEGTTWRYRLTSEPGNAAAILTREIRPAENAQLGNALRLETKIDARLRATTFLKNIGDAVFAIGKRRSDGSIVSFDPPVTILPANTAGDESWDFTGEIAGVDCEADLRILGEEEIEVPAGKFRATHLHGQQSGGYITTVERWFVRDVGWAKEVVTQRSPTGELLVRNTTELLARPVAQVPPAPASKQLEVSISTSSEGDSLTTISAEALQIVARWRGHGLARGAKLRAVWVAENTGETAPADYTVDEATTIITGPTAFGRFTLSRPPDGWAMGRYRVDFYLGPVLTETVKLVISRSSPLNQPPSHF